MIDRFRVGVITAPHGIKGEAKVYPTTQDPDRLRTLKTLYINTPRGEESLTLEGVRFSKNMAIMKFAGIDTPEAVRSLRQTDLFVDRAHATPLKEGENYIGDLVDLTVVTETGEVLGQVIEVFPTGANHVLKVQMSQKNIYIPFIKECVLDVNLEEGTILVHLLDGLLEL